MARRIEKKLQSRFDREVMPHLGAMYGMALKLTSNSTEAEDLVQDSLLRAFRFFDKFTEGTNCKAWLFKILTNTFINKYRKRVRESEVFSTSTPEDHGVEAAGAAIESGALHVGNPERDLMRKVLAEKINSALEQISVDFRMVVVLADLEEFTYREISEIIDCPIGTVMSRLYRGRRQMQARLQEICPESCALFVGTDQEAPRSGDSEDRADGGACRSGGAEVTSLDEYRRKVMVAQ